jgi:hypothetical protein
MRQFDSDVRFFVAGDRKTPKEAYELVLSLGENSTVCLPESGHKWKCSEAIGWNTLARRNIAFLEALKWGADIIYSWDNDNLPVDRNHFKHLDVLHTFGGYGRGFKEANYFSGIKLTSENGWFDPGQLLIPPTRHRGVPYDKPPSKIASFVTRAKVGVAAGLVIGDPDCDATTRIERRPDAGSTHVFGATGAVIDPRTYTVFNSQNTAVIRDLIPAWFMMPGVGRHDDIYASLIVQRVARARGYHVHFGQPFTYQQRNTHDQLVDLRAEIDGMGNVTTLAGALDAMHLPGKSVIGDVRRIYENLRATCTTLIPYPAIVAALAYLDDCEGLDL